jgi:hypothetical protein
MKRFKERVRKLTRRTRGVSLEAMVKQLAVYLCGCGNISVSVRRPRSSNALTNGSGADCVLGPGSSASGAGGDLLSCENEAWASAKRRKPLEALTVRGDSLTARPSRWLCPMLTLTRSVFRRWFLVGSLIRRTAVYGPVRTGQWATAYLCRFLSSYMLWACRPKTNLPPYVVDSFDVSG